MASIIECDKCKTQMYNDSRSEKGAYCKIGITYTDGYTVWNLCRKCHKELMINFIGEFTEEEYEEQYGKGDD